eukprot:scaffold56435_cov65-Phaeocystis_antarctica.AAC.3
MDDMWAVARHGEHVQGRGGSDCGSWTNPMSNVVKRGHMLHCRPDSMREVASCYGRAWGGRTCAPPRSSSSVLHFRKHICISCRPHHK